MGEIGDELMISEKDALRRQLSQCWNIPAGARDAKDLVVAVKLKVNPDATVREASIVERGIPRILITVWRRKVRCVR